MKKPKKSLQKFTEINKIKEIFSMKSITPTAVLEYNLTTKEYGELNSIINKKLNTLKGEEKDAFLKQIEQILTETCKNQLWEYNHNQITWAISSLMQECGRMPSKHELAEKTGLSRQTVHKHLKEYATHPQYLGQVEQFRFMTSKVLAKVFQYAVNGDVRAAKLYFEVMGGVNGQASNNTLIQQQNNYIQINGTVLSQDVIKQLNASQLNEIEALIKNFIPAPKQIIPVA